MADVMWIKITTNIFEDEKFDAIGSLADRNMIQLAWIKLLCLAGRCNDNGFLTLSREIPYTDEMMAIRFNMSIGDIQRALELFQQLKMIEVVDDVYMVSNWLAYQNGDDLELLKQQNRARQQRFRDKQKALRIEEKEKRNVTDNVTNNVNCSISISHNDNNIVKEIIDYLNNKANTKYKYTSDKTRKYIHARLGEGFTIEDFKTVIDKKCAEWLNTEWEKFLRPETLFGTKFEGYLNQNTAEKKGDWFK